MLKYYFRLARLASPFNQYSELEQMLALRKMGFSYQVLADTFHVDKRSISRLCTKFGLGETTVVTTVIRSAPTKPVKPTYTEEKINPGLTYAEYVQREKDRKRKRLINNGPVQLPGSSRPE